MSLDPTSLSNHVRVFVKEGRRRLLTLTAIFSVVAVGALFIGLALPKRYDASTLILVEANNIIKPLMEGRAVPTTVSDQTAVVNQIVLGRKVMREMLQFGGWVKPKPARQPDPREEERMIAKLRAHIKIETSRDEMVRISYSDSDPERTYKIANKLAEIYLRESDEGKERESREAFDFIDRQVREYGDKLTELHHQVLAQYRGDVVKPQPQDGVPTPTPPAAAPVSPHSKISAQDLADLRAEEALLETQIARTPKAEKTQAPAHDMRAEDAARARVSRLMDELDRLRTTFTDEHPDVQRVRRELDKAKEEVARLEHDALARENAAQLSAKIDDDVARAARQRLEDVQRRIAIATDQPIRRSPVVLTHTPAVELDPEMRMVGRDTTLSEILRRYEATRDVYQDLLKRRENARVSMELDAQHRGLNMRVQEAAEMPASASGLRLMHLSLIGLIVAFMVPFGILFLIVRFDHRVRSPHQIERLVPLLGSISYSPTHREKSRFRSREMAAALMIAGVFVVYAAIFVIKLRSS